MRQKCYSRPGARDGQRKGVGIRWQEIPPGNSGVHRQTKESRSLQTDQKLHILGDKGPSNRQRKMGRGRNLLSPHVTFSTLFPHCNKISLTDKKHSLSTDP